MGEGAEPGLLPMIEEVASEPTKPFTSTLQVQMPEASEEIIDFNIEQKKKCGRPRKTEQRGDFLQESMPCPTKSMTTTACPQHC